MNYWVAVVDDDRTNRKAADTILTMNGCRVTCLDSGEALLKFIDNNTYGELPDIILLDVHMDKMDGFETLVNLQRGSGWEIPVIFLTADDNSDTESRALAAGANDFVAKPFNPTVLLMRVRNTIELMRLQKNLQKEVKRMTDEFIKEHKRNEKLSMQIVRTLAGTIDAKDSYTKGHSSRVADYARRIAEKAGFSKRAQDEIYIMGLLHDVGKIGVPDNVINKPARLTDEEFALIKKHPSIGFDILKNVTEMPKLSVGARWHHERYDGKGYPDGISGTDIPEEARIIAVADAYDAMSSKRSYRDVLPQDVIIRELEKGRGTQFDPQFADIMLQLIHDDSKYNMREQKAMKSEGTADDPDSEKNDSGFIESLNKCGFNTSMGLKYCMSDADCYEEMLCEFLNSYDERAEKLRIYFDSDNYEQYRIAVHSLKSASKTIGADKLSEKARILEKAASEGQTDFISQNHDQLMVMLAAAASDIRSALEDQ